MRRTATGGLRMFAENPNRGMSPKVIVMEKTTMHSGSTMPVTLRSPSAMTMDTTTRMTGTSLLVSSII
ncbi:MAG: hypothetical protein BWX71_02582 [Deltaproteobacteria bacterium ADurb.Bin072]|nr:MAG: hypothetical protein BWX71_02582 [Deltaproteobacteria bacterium ADurb.Bin072]